MPSALQIRKQLLQAFDEVLLPACAAGTPLTLVLAEPPLNLPRGVISWQLPVSLLQNKTTGLPQAWPEAAVNSTRHFCMIFALQGPIDLRIGITEHSAQAAKARGEQIDSGCLAVRLPSLGGLLLPPDTPYSDGSIPHWEEPGASSPDSKILWILVAPKGILCHLCHTKNNVHKSDHSLLFQEPSLLSLVSLLVQELRRRDETDDALTHHYTMALFLNVRRRLMLDAPMLANTVKLLPPEIVLSDHPDSADRLIKSASEFVHTYLREPITLPEIAAHCRVSPTHLNRLFRSKVGLSVKRFVSQKRIQAAQRILIDSDLPIKEIAHLVGFARSSHFCRVFQYTVMMSPTEFRVRGRERPATTSN